LFYQLPQSLENLKVISYTEEQYNLPMGVEASLSESRVAPKASFELNVNITNFGDSIISPSYASQKTIGVDSLSDFMQSTVIAPGKTKQLQWRFASPYGEKKTYYITLLGPMVDRNFQFTVDPTLSAEGYSDLVIKNVYAVVEEDQMIIQIEVTNDGNKNLGSVIASVITDVGTQQQSFTLGSGAAELLEYKFPAQEGTHNYEVLVESENSSVNSFGTLAVPIQREKTTSIAGLLSSFIQKNSALIYFAIGIIVLGALLMILVSPLREDRKTPFEEQKEWGKLMKLRKQ